MRKDAKVTTYPFEALTSSDAKLEVFDGKLWTIGVEHELRDEGGRLVPTGARRTFLAVLLTNGRWRQIDLDGDHVEVLWSAAAAGRDQLNSAVETVLAEANVEP